MKGMMFNNKYGMWEAVLLGTKTNTRRSGQTLNPLNADPAAWRLKFASVEKFQLQNTKTSNTITIEPRYKVGEVCFLQEPVLDGTDTITNDNLVLYQYKDEKGCSDMDAHMPLIKAVLTKGKSWTNKMFMGRQHARFYVKITGVKLERFQSISADDCLAEGLHNKMKVGYRRIFALYEKNKNFKSESTRFTLDPKESYQSLIAVIQDDTESWDKNWWCFSYYFKLLTKLEVQALRHYNLC